MWIWIVVIATAVCAKQNFFVEANKLYDQGKYLEAVKYYRGAIQNGEFEPYAWFNLGNTLVRLEKHHLALVAYRRAIELAPRFVRPWVLLGDLYFIHDVPGMAIVAYKRAVELGEDSEHLHYALGESYRKLREFALAEKEYETVVRRNPDRVDCWFALASIREELKDPEDAVRLLRKAVDQSPAAGADVHFYMAFLYQQQDSVHQSIRSLEDGLMLNPGQQVARRHLANLYLQGGSPWMALFTLEQGLDKATGNAKHELQVDLGQIYFEQKRLDESFQYFFEAWKSGSSQGRIGAENVANVWFNQGDTLRAEEAYRRIRRKE